MTIFCHKFVYHVGVGLNTVRCTIMQPRLSVVKGLFTSNESLVRGKRCGSVVTMVSEGRSVYGLVKKFIRVLCRCMRCCDFGLITWFPLPVYPDGDPLTVRINLGGLDVNNLDRVRVISLNVIQPARVSVWLDPIHSCMYMMRFEGVDTIVQ